MEKEYEESEFGYCDYCDKPYVLGSETDHNPETGNHYECELDELIHRMRGIDWYYQYSDDYSVWDRGRRSIEKLIFDLSKMNLTEDNWEEIKKATKSWIEKDFEQRQETLVSLLDEWKSRLEYLYRGSKNDN